MSGRHCQLVAAARLSAASARPHARRCLLGSGGACLLLFVIAAIDLIITMPQSNGRLPGACKGGIHCPPCSPFSHAERPAALLRLRCGDRCIWDLQGATSLTRPVASPHLPPPCSAATPRCGAHKCGARCSFCVFRQPRTHSQGDHPALCHLPVLPPPADAACVQGRALLLQQPLQNNAAASAVPPGPDAGRCSAFDLCRPPPSLWLLHQAVCRGTAAKGGLHLQVPTGSPVSNRIINGWVDSGNWGQFVAYISFTSGAFCTGSLVGPAHILTAAHCLVDYSRRVLDPSEVAFVWLQGELYTVGTVMVDSGYNFLSGPSDQYANDIGMLGLTAAPPPSPIALSSYVPAPGDVVLAAGYGAIEPGADAPTAESLMLTDMLVYDPASCTDPAGPFADDFCAGMAALADGSDGGHACHSDSGDPVVGSDGYLAGVVSWGKDDCSTPYSYYTSVAQHVDTINAVVAAWQVA
ncbi:hypothetical protein ABPG75_004212 [Micractinium tetrahymenae]